MDFENDIDWTTRQGDGNLLFRSKNMGMCWKGKSEFDLQATYSPSPQTLILHIVLRTFRNGKGGCALCYHGMAIKHRYRYLYAEVFEIKVCPPGIKMRVIWSSCKGDVYGGKYLSNWHLRMKNIFYEQLQQGNNYIKNLKVFCFVRS